MHEKRLTKKQHEAVAKDQEKQARKAAVNTLAHVEKHWDKAVELAAAKRPPGGLSSVFDGPLLQLGQQSQEALEEIGADTGAVKLGRTADAHEKRLPKHLRRAYRHGNAMRSALREHAAK